MKEMLYNVYVCACVCVWGGGGVRENIRSSQSSSSNQSIKGGRAQLISQSSSLHSPLLRRMFWVIRLINTLPYRPPHPPTPKTL